jgi:hypothetical protein
MADHEPKKETTRIPVSPQPSPPPSPPVESRDTVRIHLPTRPPANLPSAPVDSAPPAGTAAAAVPAPLPTPGPKKETARITVSPDLPTKPAVQMKKTQPLIDLPAIETPSTAVTVTSQPQLRIDQIPMPLCWTLLVASATVLILQIWNYLS